MALRINTQNSSRKTENQANMKRNLKKNYTKDSKKQVQED